jgi:hypothetical protein
MRDPRLWSYGRFFSYSFVLTALFLLAHLAGLQAHTSVLAGTHSGSYMEQYFGLVYLILYIIAVCIVPIMVIAGSLLWLGGRVTRPAGQPKQETNKEA